MAAAIILPPLLLHASVNVYQRDGDCRNDQRAQTDYGKHPGHSCRCFVDLCFKTGGTWKQATLVPQKGGMEKMRRQNSKQGGIWK